MRAFVSLTLLMAMASLTRAEHAVAQPPTAAETAPSPSASELALARETFESGLRFAREGHWPEAREAFSQAYALSRRPPILINLASAQSETGALVEAGESYRRYLREATGRDARHKEAAEQALQELELRLPRARITVSGLLDTDEVRLDDRALPRAALDSALPLNPGEHLLIVRSGTVLLGQQAFSLREGQGQDVYLALSRPDINVNVVPNEHETDDDRRVLGELQGDPVTEISDGSPWWQSPILWVGVGLAVAGGVTAALVLSTQPGAQPYQGDLGTVGFR